jgi:hypothetical protein
VSGIFEAQNQCVQPDYAVIRTTGSDLVEAEVTVTKNDVTQQDQYSLIVLVGCTVETEAKRPNNLAGV